MTHTLTMNLLQMCILLLRYQQKIYINTKYNLTYQYSLRLTFMTDYEIYEAMFAGDRMLHKIQALKLGKDLLTAVLYTV